VKTASELPMWVTTNWLRSNGFGTRMTLWRKIGKGEFPPPDGKMCRQMAWKRETFVRHLQQEGLA
jgi:hypothetical protein